MNDVEIATILAALKVYHEAIQKPIDAGIYDIASMNGKEIPLDLKAIDALAEKVRAMKGA
jgi:hypothetical protein